MSTVEPPLASSSTLRPAAQPSPPLAARAPSLPTAASSSSAGGSRPIRSPADYASDQDDDGDDDNAHLVQERAPIPPFRKGHRPRASVAGLLDDAPTAFAAERQRRMSAYDGADAGIVEQVRAEWTRRTGAVRGVVRRNEGPFSLLSLPPPPPSRAHLPCAQRRSPPHRDGAARLLAHQHVRQAPRTRRASARLAGTPLSLSSLRPALLVSFCVLIQLHSLQLILIRMAMTWVGCYTCASSLRLAAALPR